jgi:hypothetical protein
MQMEPEKVHIFLIEEGLGQSAEAKTAMLRVLSRPGSNLGGVALRRKNAGPVFLVAVERSNRRLSRPACRRTDADAGSM